MTKFDPRLGWDQSNARLEKVELTKEQEEEIRRVFGKFDRNVKFLEAHLGEWLGLYPGEWVVVQDEKLVGHGKNRRNLFAQLRTRGIDLTTSHTRQLERKTLILEKGS